MEHDARHTFDPDCSMAPRCEQNIVNERKNCFSELYQDFISGLNRDEDEAENTDSGSLEEEESDTSLIDTLTELANRNGHGIKGQNVNEFISTGQDKNEYIAGQDDDQFITGHKKIIHIAGQNGDEDSAGSMTTRKGIITDYFGKAEVSDRGKDGKDNWNNILEERYRKEFTMGGRKTTLNQKILSGKRSGDYWKLSEKDLSPEPKDPVPQN